MMLTPRKHGAYGKHILVGLLTKEATIGNMHFSHLPQQRSPSETLNKKITKGYNFMEKYSEVASE